MTQDDIDYVKRCVKDNDMHKFYVWKKWRRVRKEVLKLDHKEFCDCKAAGRYRQATTVHHINYVKSHPELALEIMFVNEQGELERNLISLCHDCHEKRHGYRHKNICIHFTNEEHWE